MDSNISIPKIKMSVDNSTDSSQTVPRAKIGTNLKKVQKINIQNIKVMVIILATH